MDGTCDTVLFDSRGCEKGANVAFERIEPQRPRIEDACRIITGNVGTQNTNCAVETSARPHKLINH